MFRFQASHSVCLLRECFDMLRKLLLVGLLTIVERGSVLQICVGMWTCASSSWVARPPMWRFQCAESPDVGLQV